MSRSNYDKPFYVDVGTSIVAIRCASNHDVLVRYDHVWHPHTLDLAQEICDRMNKEVEIGRPLRNCDVGTAEEKTDRFIGFCRAHSDKWNRCKRSCPLYKSNTDEIYCGLAWAQMPYEEGGAK